MNNSKTKKLQLVFIVYWFLLIYIVAALVWWFIALNNQNKQMSAFELTQLKKDDPTYYDAVNAITEKEKRKTAQYIGEGVVFFLFIMAGAFYILRSVKKQLQIAQEQKNFMMSITHELKTPIAVAKLNLETLQKRKLDEATQQKLIQNTIQEANRLNALCNNMLLVSQIEERNYNVTNENIDLSSLTTECVNEFASRFPNRSYQPQIANDVLVKGDRLLLQMAINNLIDNATKYSKGGAIEINLSNTNNKIVLAVKDNGEGIAEEERKKVFEKFYRIGNKATKEAKGTGLGLYLTKKIATQHNATIAVSANTPKGSVFAIKFNS